METLESSQNSALGELRDAIIGSLQIVPAIKLAIVYGSAARGSLTAHSDLDLAVAAEQPLSAQERLKLIESLAERIGRPVDLVDLHATGEPLLGKILGEGVVLLRDVALLAQFIRRHFYESADMLPLHRRIVAQRTRAYIGQ